MSLPQHLTVYSPPSADKSDFLFSGIWLRWGKLTLPERVVCLALILVPVWWIIGWNYLLFLLNAGIFIRDWVRHRTIRLARPSLAVVALLFFGAYRYGSTVINSEVVTLRTLMDPVSLWISIAVTIWYIQSNKVSVRPQVLGWAVACLVAEMMAIWLFVHFVLGEPYYTPPRSLFASITSKGERFVPGAAGGGNFLLLYNPLEKGFGGLARFGYFFPHPVIASFVTVFATLVMLDIRHRLASILLTTSSLWLLFTTQTRSSWLAFPIILVLRWLLTAGRVWGPSALCFLLAVASFVSLSLPPVFDAIVDTYQVRLEEASSARKASTEVRSKIYEQTWAAVVEEPVWGHGVNGPAVVPDFEVAQIGTESFILGTLLYKSGLVGSFIFVTYWISLLAWLYNTRFGRPLFVLLLPLYLTLCATVSEFSLVDNLLVLLCIITRDSTPQTSQSPKELPLSQQAR